MKYIFILLLSVSSQLLSAQVLDTLKTYTPNGDLACIEVWDKSKSYYTLVYQKVFWQILPNREYLFVSKEGFVTVKDSVYVTLDSLTPDNLIDNNVFDNYNGVEGFHTYLWKNGKREIYTGGEPDGTIEMVYDGDNKGVYEWKKGKKTFIRKLNRKDIKEKKKNLREAEKMMQDITK